MQQYFDGAIAVDTTVLQLAISMNDGSCFIICVPSFILSYGFIFNLLKSSCFWSIQ